MAQPVVPTDDAATPVAEPPAVVAEPTQVNVATPVTAPPPPAPPQVDEPLVVLHEVEPDFPISIVRRQKKGNLVMRFVVQPDGTVAQIEVVKTSNPFLNPSATHALSQWRFQPLSRARTATVEMAFDVAQQLSE
jgi:protein TonB